MDGQNQGHDDIVVLSIINVVMMVFESLDY